MADNTVFRVSTDYDRQAAEARKRRRMADLLAQQVMEPTDYGRGPIPAAAPLVQGLQAFLVARAGRKADEAEETALEAKTRAEREAAQQVAATGSQIAGRLMGGAPVRDIAPPDASGLGEVAIESRYRKDPEGALAIGMTQRGGEAISKAPLLAAMLANQMKEPKAPESRIGKPSPSDFTPKSLAEFEKTGDPNVLVAVPRVAPTTNIINRYGSPMPVIDTATGQPVLVQPSQTGGPPSVVQGFAPIPSNAPPMNEGQANAAGFADRINSALPSLERFSPPRSAIVAEGLPLGLGSSQLTDKDQQFFQAERNFITAVLRRESGAAIAPSEFESARRQYIPQPGDGPETLKQKARERRLALENMRRSAGPAYKPSKVVEVEY